MNNPCISLGSEGYDDGPRLRRDISGHIGNKYKLAVFVLSNECILFGNCIVTEEYDNKDNFDHIETECFQLLQMYTLDH